MSSSSSSHFPETQHSIRWPDIRKAKDDKKKLHNGNQKSKVIIPIIKLPTNSRQTANSTLESTWSITPDVFGGAFEWVTEWCGWSLTDCNGVMNE